MTSPINLIDFVSFTPRTVVVVVVVVVVEIHPQYVLVSTPFICNINLVHTAECVYCNTLNLLNLVAFL